MEMISCCGRGAIGFKPGTGVFRITYVKPYGAALWRPRVQDVQLSMILVTCTNVNTASVYQLVDACANMYEHA
jgi:hypothetical protein